MVAWLLSLLELGSSPDDDEQTRIEKRMLIAVSVSIAVLAVLWSGLYLLFGEPVAAAIPGTYASVSLASLAWLAATGRYGAYRSSQLVLILFLPFVLSGVLGGFVLSGGVVLWSLLAPVGSMLFGPTGQAWRWFAAYAALVLATGLVEGNLRPDNRLPEAMRTAFVVMNVGGVSAVAMFSLGLFVGQRDAARARSERLLSALLPASIVRRLRDETATIAEHFDEVTVLFADVVGFTRMTERLPPARMVEVLDQVFSRFDALVHAHGVEKVRTIGDAYMILGGAPEPRADHAEVMVRLGLEMAAWMEAQRWEDGLVIQLRIGVNSGPVVAGVIGRSRYQYDVWGDAVNLAARMESHGVPGRVQIGPGTHALVRDRFACTSRGEIEIKGKGRIETWLVEP